MNLRERQQKVQNLRKKEDEEGFTAKAKFQKRKMAWESVTWLYTRWIYDANDESGSWQFPCNSEVPVPRRR